MSRLIGFFPFLCGAFCLIAQTPDTATVHGQVTDPSHGAVAGVEVAVKNSQTGLERSAQTDPSGNLI